MCIEHLKRTCAPAVQPPMDAPWEVCAVERQYRDRQARGRARSIRQTGGRLILKLTWFVGVDWGSQKHQACVLDANGKVLGERLFEHSGAGLSEMADWLLPFAQGEAAEVGVAIETPRGPVVEGLMERGFAVHSINPKQLDRFRDRFSPAGAKAVTRTTPRHFQDAKAYESDESGSSSAVASGQSAGAASASWRTRTTSDSALWNARWDVGIRSTEASAEAAVEGDRQLPAGHGGSGRGDRGGAARAGEPAAHPRPRARRLDRAVAAGRGAGCPLRATDLAQALGVHRFGPARPYRSERQRTDDVGWTGAAGARCPGYRAAPVVPLADSVSLPRRGLRYHERDADG